MIYKLYRAFLYFWGFKVDSDPDITGDEKITDMLRRQKQRLGIIWWLGVAGISGFWVWLVFHILGVW